MPQKIGKFSDAVIGESYCMTLLVMSFTEGTTKIGNPFVSFRFMDGKSIVNAKMFNITETQIKQMGISDASVVDAIVEVSDFAGKSYNVRNISPNFDSNLSKDSFIVRAPIDEDIMYEEIINALKGSHIDNETEYLPLNSLTIEILEKFRDVFTTSSAALVVHHNYKGGLLYHTYRMVKSANVIASIYSGLNKELLLCGTALHDIGKIMEYKTSELGETEMKDLGVLYGHPFCGALIIKCMSAKKNYNPEEVKLLIHILLSHHGKGEYGAAVAPAIPEAFAVHHIDNMDAKITQCEKIYEEIGGGTITEKRPFAFDNRLYKPNYL